MRRVRWLACTASIVVLIATCRLRAAPSTVWTNPLWEGLIPRLVHATRIPIALPTYFPGGLIDPDTANARVRVYVSIQEATASRYEIELAATPNCHGAHACHFGSVTGTSGSHGARLRGRPVPLARGYRGYFLAATCGANCGDASLEWAQRGVDYTISSKAGSVTELVHSVNSAILNGNVRRNRL